MDSNMLPGDLSFDLNSTLFGNMGMPGQPNVSGNASTNSIDPMPMNMNMTKVGVDQSSSVMMNGGNMVNQPMGGMSMGISTNQPLAPPMDLTGVGFSYNQNFGMNTSTQPIPMPSNISMPVSTSGQPSMMNANAMPMMPNNNAQHMAISQQMQPQQYNQQMMHIQHQQMMQRRQQQLVRQQQQQQQQQHHQQQHHQQPPPQQIPHQPQQQIPQHPQHQPQHQQHQPQPHQPQQSLHGTGDQGRVAWQSEDDLPQRRKMIAKIVTLLQQRKPDAPPEWIKKLPDMARRLEDSLYRTATSLEEYATFSTLKQRLQQLAMTMGAHPKKSGGQSTSGQPIAMPPGLGGNQPQQKVFVNMKDINPSLGQPSQPSNFNQVNTPVTASTSQIPMPSNMAQMPGQQNRQSMPMQQPPSSGSSRQPTAEQRQHVLRQQQQRLLLLRHASKCPVAEGGCRATPHCAAMKKLWLHIAKCKDHRCQVSHCVSSRYVLSHYHRCKDPRCAVCGPVRDAIQRHQDKSKTPDSNAMGSVLGAPTSQPQPQSNPVKRQKTESDATSTPNQSSQNVDQMKAAQLKQQTIRALQARAATMTKQQLIQQVQVTRAATQQAITQSQVLAQQAQIAAQVANSATPRSRSHKMAEANAKRSQAIAAKQKVDQLQTQFQALAQMLTKGNEQSVARTPQPAQAPTTTASHHQTTTPLMSQAQVSQPRPQVSSTDSVKMASQPSTSSASSTPLQMPPDLLKPPEAMKSESGGGIQSGKIPEVSNASNKSDIEKKKIEQPPAIKVEDSASSTAIPASSSNKLNTTEKTPATSEATLKQESLMRSSRPPAKARPKYTPEGTSLLSQFTDEQVQSHLDSLQKGFCSSTTAAQLKTRLSPILKNLMDHEFGWVFNTPVDPVALGIPDYFTIVKHPMDLGTVKKRLESGYYKHVESFAQHVRQTFNNAILYNEDQSDVYSLARDMLSQFDEEYSVIQKEIAEEERKRREGENACRLCGGERFTFEPLVFYCNGPCNARIRRNSYYYTALDNKYHWCQQCYSEIKDPEIKAGDKTVRKEDLVKKKNDEMHEEPWVQCDHCNRWVHQICALFNGRNGGKEEAKQSEPFYCPNCILELRKNDPKKVPIKPHALDAIDLQKTKLTDYIESRITKLLTSKRQEEAEATGKPISEIETAEGIVIRQVSNIERQLIVRDKMYARYKESHKYPAEFRYKSKCLCMFQELDGVSTLLFGMYVHEFDEQEPEPNQRRVYISYLDSVQYFNPRHLRTVVYHEILIGYLAYVRHRGFHTAHIWACPPLKGDDYILYCHPEDQKTPKSERLRQWYVTMLIKAQQQGVVTEIINMYSEYWRGKESTPTTIPYFEGDYWVGIAEEFIKELEDSKKTKSEKKPNQKKSNKKKNSSKATKKKGNNGKELHEEDNESNDPLMVKLGTVIEPMKDDFIVVKMQYSCRVCFKVILSGNRWKDPTTKTSEGLNPESLEYNVCDACYEKQLSKPPKEQHPVGKDEVSPLIPVPVKVPTKCTDVDEIMECEFFDTRQAFLSLCQGNHYQFDQLRRAKHTSFMVLYHLHNPTAPAYIYVCNDCQNDIVSGNRWHCDQCNDFDVCDACNAKNEHPHTLKAIAVRDSTKEDNAKTRKAREERTRSIQLHMQLLVHASGCNNATCPSANCSKMKNLLKHGSSCKLRATGGCHICRRIWALLQIHARQCRQEQCPVPRCKDLKEHLRRLQRQQQQMDDRRRAHVTQQYRQQQNEETESTNPPSSEVPGSKGAGRNSGIKGTSAQIALKRSNSEHS